jgi:predicted PurR-regulated permease PerM
LAPNGRGVAISAAVYGVLVASMLRFVVVPIFLSLVIAALLEPLVGWLSRRMPRLAATRLVMLGSLGADRDDGAGIRSDRRLGA